MRIKKEVKVGIFAVITLAALYWGINFLRGQDLFSKYNKYYATYDQVNGVQKSSAIMIKGYKIGVISDISYNPEKTDKIVLEFNVRSKYKIPENSKARIFSDGLLGGKAIEIELGTSERYLEDGDTLRSEMEKGLLEVAGSELEFIKQKANNLANDLTVTLGNINSLLETAGPGLSKTMDNIAGITGSLNEVLNSEKNSLRGIITNINALSEALGDSSERIGNIITNVEGFTDSLSKADISSLVANLSASLEDLNGALASVNAGEGSIGKLIKDDALYDSLVMASGNLARLLDDVRLHPGRYVNISVFGNKKDK